MVAVKRLEGPDAPASPPVDALEAVESLESIARGAEEAARAGATASAPAQQAQQQAQDQQNQAAAAAAVGELVRLLGVVRKMAAKFAAAADVLPEAKTYEIWNDEQLADLAEPLLAVMARHGDEFNAFMETFGPYVMLIGAAAMPAIATRNAIREHKANTINVKARVVPDAPSPGG